MVTPDTVCTSQGLGTKPPLATTVAAMCSNWLNKLEESVEKLQGFFNNFRSSAGRGPPLWRPVRLWALCLVE
jgi:hypothetical protein